MPDNSSVSIPQVGAVVEVKNQDGVYQEATINKLTDASIYTVGKSILSLLTQRLVFSLQLVCKKTTKKTCCVYNGFQGLYFPLPEHYVLKLFRSIFIQFLRKSKEIILKGDFQIVQISTRLQAIIVVCVCGC